MAASRRRQRLTEEHETKCRQRLTEEQETKTEPTRPKMEQPGRPSIRINLDPAAVSDTAIMSAANSDLDAAWSREELDAALSGGDSYGDGNVSGGARRDTRHHEIDWDQFVEVD